VFIFCLKISRTRKFASKPKFRGNEYVCFNKDTGVSDKGQPLYDQSDENSCVEHNLTASNKTLHGTSVNTEIKVGENNSCNTETNLTHDGNTVVSMNLLFACIQKNSDCKHCGDNISFLKINQSGEVL
jgi:hypothetical protein